MLRLRVRVLGGDQDGFTLPELVTVIAIIGILVAIAVIIWLNILERRRVEAATNQLVSDLRLANSNASNQLTDWRVVLVPERADEDEGPDYYMVRLVAPYPATSPPKIDPDTPPEPRTFPGNVKIVNIAGQTDDQTQSWWVKPWDSSPGSADPPSRSVEFNTDGTVRFYGAVSGSTCVTVDGDPENRVVVTSATSRVKVKPDVC